MYNPVSTYRIQFHKNFTFSDFEAIIPYLHQLGISTVYASPIFAATPGSMHGYDVVNPLQINPEIGTLQQLRNIHSKLKQLGMGWLQDIVPNHMAYHQNNLWLMDVLEKGQKSVYSTYFDMLWDNPAYDGRIMVPFLGSQLDDVIKNRELQIAYQNNQLVFSYGGQAYPLQLHSYGQLLPGDKQVQQFDAILKSIANADSIADKSKYAGACNEIKTQYANIFKKVFTGSYLKKVNSNAALLKSIASQQAYALCYWQATDSEINFRRFFTVNGLICLNMQNSEVFNHYHQLIKQLLNEGILQGLRVDHIDGLYDPELYLAQLRALAGDDTYIIVEKILEQGEPFPTNWPIQGNTGYDYLGLVNNVFTNNKNQAALSKLYQQLTHQNTDPHQGITEKKSLILFEHMAGELENLYQLFLSLDLADSKTIEKVKPADLKNAIAQLLIHFPVYRFYGNILPLGDIESVALRNIFKQIIGLKPQLKAAVKLLQAALLKNATKNSNDYNTRAIRFYQRCMQFTGPLMAKGVEDTLMYTYNRFIDHNEVGDSPEAFGIKVSEYHRLMGNRQQQWPLTMNATSTHDTKRGEDVRSRLNVLTDVADEWAQQILLWQQMNKGLKTDGLPDANDEYFIYQTIIGAYPLPQQGDDDFKNRVQDYLVKALREAKLNSNWAQPNQDYEAAVKSFVNKLLNKKGQFWLSFVAFQQRIANYGVINSLSQVLLKYTSPGMSDLYQGCELWDNSLVDPDNRRPVDYKLRQKLLNDTTGKFESQIELWQHLWQNRYNAQIKLALTTTLLAERKQNAGVFTTGAYIPLKVKGKYKQNVLAFARQLKQTWYVIAIPLHLAAIIGRDEQIENFDWQDTRIILPDEAPLQWQHLLTQTKGFAAKGIPVGNIFKPVCPAILKLHTAEKGAGVLMHITSLASPYGIGDIGPEAHKFADMLHQNRQKYWQTLPVNMVQESSGYSPYSSESAMAGNILLISPQLLADDGLLDKNELKKYRFESQTVDYQRAVNIKSTLFNLAYRQYTKLNNTTAFEAFKKQEAYWLDDFSVYSALKNKFNGKPWYEWPAEYKLRNAASLKKLGKDEAHYIEITKWLQYVFATQWQKLKNYCHHKNIQLIGDIPFYVSYDSADVWQAPQLFSLDKQGSIISMAGVPPDYFSAEGQLWGMPVYRWDEMKKDNYQWWLLRIKKNMEYFNLLRLDHFRAFVSYWEVPAHQKTAINGQWQQGPGSHLFNRLQQQLGNLPFLAQGRRIRNLF
ncbi:malto-oligosyltrehalose synthase [Mucilaginibacter gracilis]|uniref:malto-oligosyltrehalose synthase n=1 Tax=Mucilaginibacter gracilis TaxID=423350 RepID=UPI000EB35924|nr:malto-oligosyltrehalose synthase [Mucilaginibacter gracilis]